MLALEVEWLTGVCYAAHDPSDETPQWPIQPDRVFSALVATWGAHGEPGAERQALAWLEQSKPPRLAAAPATRRTTVTSYVPPNDPGPTDIRILPEQRRRQPRQFPASVIDGAACKPDAPALPHLRLVWDDDADAPTFAALDALARDTSYVGHSSSLVRCRFLRDAGETIDGLQAHRTETAPYPGRLAELERLHARHQNGDETARPKPATLLCPLGVAQPTPPASVFGEDWIVLEHVGGERPDLRAAPVLARRLRDAVMGAWPKADAIPEWLSGHAADRAPTTQSHLAIVPLAFAGFRNADGRLMGLGLVLPRTRDGDARNALVRAVMALHKRGEKPEQLDPDDDDEADDVLRLNVSHDKPWFLARTIVPDKDSLRPRRYLGAWWGASGAGMPPWHRWSSVTPIALDRHPKGDKAAQLADAAAIIAESCAHVGLPRPIVDVHKHAAITGAPSAWPAGGSPRWLNWARPKSLDGRPLFHATLSFKEPVRGPLILGAGRFFGLGLCLPVREESRP